uniref:Uncharacterized protein n=1 Tax=Arundo donax TaxID=35708 RepID=A0A0A9FRX2_ARUDO
MMSPTPAIEGPPFAAEL